MLAGTRERLDDDRDRKKPGGTWTVPFGWKGNTGPQRAAAMSAARLINGEHGDCEIRRKVAGREGEGADDDGDSSFRLGKVQIWG